MIVQNKEVKMASYFCDFSVFQNDDLVALYDC